MSAFETILFQGKIGEIYNISSDEEFSIKDVAKIIISKFFPNLKDNLFENYITYVEDRPFNDKRYYISNDKLKKLGWKIEKNFDEELSKLI